MRVPIRLLATCQRVLQDIEGEDEGVPRGRECIFGIRRQGMLFVHYGSELLSFLLTN